MPQSDKNDTLLNKIDAKKKFPLSRTTRIILFFFLVSIEYSINVSSGLLSSASKIIKDSLKMNDTDFGLFGTCYGIGRVLGSLFFMLASDTLNRKYILISNSESNICKEATLKRIKMFDSNVMFIN